MPVRHVLIVDDSKSARLMLRKMLQSFGLTVDTVDSAEDALNYLRAQRPDGIFMDHTMPGLDGIAAVKRIKQEPAIAAIPITMYTSKDEPAYQEEAHQAGAIGVLVKPATPDALGNVLNQMNTQFDKMAIQTPSVPSLSDLAPAASMGEAVSSGQIEKIALEKAELVVYDAIESQVLPLLNDVIAKLRRELKTGQEEHMGRIAAQICDTRLSDWRPPLDGREISAAVEVATQAQLLPLLKERFEAFQREARTDVERQAKDIATEVCQNQMHELSEGLVRQLTARFSEATQKVEETTREVALQTSQTAALRAIAETTPSTDKANRAMVEQLLQQHWMTAERELQRRIYAAATWATVIGVGAALLVYVLR
ncbi:MAG: response regulator [Candidatus Competibacteraceae bacterium]|nr:response regulator [Candidatus Competibacteraceae bacterium]